jgi:uncharacterized protein involved in type VI secretion and phage assembly
MTATAIAAVELVVGGAAWRPDAGRVLAVRVVSGLGLPTQCEVTVADGPPPALWRLGEALEVRVGGETRALFAGDVSSVELVRGAGAVSHRIRAYDALHRLRRRCRPRVFTDVTVVDVARTLAGEVGLAVSAARSGPRLDRVVQHRQDDLTLLVELAAAAGLYPVADDETLRLVDLTGDGDPVPLECGRSLWEARVEANLDRFAGRLSAIGWHPQRATVLTGDATGPAPAYPDLPDTAVTLVDQPGRDDDAMASLAQASVDASGARAVTVRGVAAGSARLRAGARIVVTGIDSTVDGRYTVCAATHTVDGHGYQTSFSTEPPEPPEAVSSCAITLGRVTQVDDPEKLGRVRVSLPALGDVDAGWLGVLCPGAGKGRGLVVLPEAGDTVVVALAHQSPADGVVLGPLYGEVAPFDPGVDGDSVRRWSLRTAGGQSMVFDDAGHRVRVADRAGSYVELAPDTVRLHAATDLVIDAPGHALTIRAASIDFEHAAIPVTV